MSSFGEIVEPSTRASWEDWDDVGGCYNLMELKWQNPLTKNLEVDNLYIFEGNYRWEVKETDKSIQKINSIKEVNLHLYKTPDAPNYICVIKNCDVMLSNDVVRLLNSLIVKSKTIMTMQVKPLSEYQTAQPLHLRDNMPCIIRQITTTNKSNLVSTNYPKLEQPNMISGVSAGVFTLREHLGLSATVVVYYLEHSQNQDIEGMKALLQKLNISQINQVKQNNALNSNLYI